MQNTCHGFDLPTMASFNNCFVELSKKVTCVVCKLPTVACINNRCVGACWRTCQNYCGLSSTITSITHEHPEADLGNNKGTN